MTTEEKIRSKEKLIYEEVSKLPDLSHGIRNVVTSSNFPVETLGRPETVDGEMEKFNSSSYRQYWDVFSFKAGSKTLNQVNTNLITHPEIIELFSDPKIFNIFYFQVYGDVAEHIDPDGICCKYPDKHYWALMMPIQIPTEDESIFKTWYDGKIIKFPEGKFTRWDVTNIYHYWEYDYPKTNKFFKLLHIDYID